MQLNLCQMVRQNTLYSAPARRENKDKLQNREQEGIGRGTGRFEDVSWAAVVQYSETTGYIWTSPLRSGPCQFGPFPPPFFPFSFNPLTNDTNFSTWRGRNAFFTCQDFKRTCQRCLFTRLPLLYLSPVVPVGRSRSSVWNASAKSWRESICPSLPLSLSLILTCVSSSASSHLRVFLCPFCRCFRNVQANLQLLVSGYCWRANGHNQRWRPTAATA